MSTNKFFTTPLKSILTKIFVLCLLFSVNSAPAQERLDIDPVVQGIWYVHAISRNEGVTINQVSPAELLCRVTATEVRMADGQVMVVDRVVIMNDVDGNPMNAVSFTNGTIWGISKSPGQVYVRVQVFPPDGKFKESIRFLVTVQK